MKLEELKKKQFVVIEKDLYRIKSKHGWTKYKIIRCRYCNKECAISFQQYKKQKYGYCDKYCLGKYLNNMIDKGDVCRCYNCKEWKPRNEFRKDTCKPGGIAHICHLCSNKNKKISFNKLSEKEQEKRKEKRRLECKKNRQRPESKIVYKNWVTKNRSRINANAIARRKRNPEKFLGIAKRYREKNRDKINTIMRDKRRNDPKFNLNSRISRAINYSLHGKKNGMFWESLVGYTAEDLMKHLESQFTDGMCWERLSELNIDHIFPISFFKYSSSEDKQFKACWALKNLRPMWAKDNMSKSDKLPWHFHDLLGLNWIPDVDKMLKNNIFSLN